MTSSKKRKLSLSKNESRISHRTFFYLHSIARSNDLFKSDNVGLIQSDLKQHTSVSKEKGLRETALLR